MECNAATSSRRTLSFSIAWALAACAVLAQPPEGVQEQPPAETVFSGLTPKAGPVVAEVGSMARIQLKEGFQAFNASDAQTALKRMGNLGVSDVVALVMPTSATSEWFIVYEWDDCGYVKDDDKDDLDADKMLASMKEGDKANNEQRKKSGLEPMHTLRFAIKPQYDEKQNSVEWALVFKGGAGEVVNFNTRRLGRMGMMKVVLVCDPQELDTILPTFREVNTEFTFIPTQGYSAYREGDKVADYTLTALVSGGAIAVAAKLGFFKKFWKFIVFGFAAVVGGIAKLFKRRKPEPTSRA